ncbi:MAG: T9SS type A sorting domain-containing protein [Flavobacteriales bacterium]|nr:T9SS type A sorting domain-containing protein [Flavobacteriales bacterium]
MRSALLVVGLLPISAFAQITIGMADMPSAGDTVRYVTSSADGFDPAETEAGFLWDYSMLEVGPEGADTCVTVGSTPFAYQFFFNNPILYPEHRADYAVRGQDFNFQVLTVNNVRDYFKRDAAGFRNVGFGANVNGVPTSTRRIPVDWIHRFPMEFGDMDTSFSEFTLSVPTLFSFTQRQWRCNEVDGWGTLYLPADTFEVLRVKSTLERTDSAYVEQFGQGFTFPEPETIEYKWIAQGMDLPVLQITVVAGQAATARFHYSPVDITTGMGQARATGLTVYPNPAEGTVWLRIPEGEWGRLEVRDASGRSARTVSMAGGTLLDMDLSGLSAGTYSVELTGPSGRVSTRLFLQ